MGSPQKVLDLRRVESWLVHLIALHSLVVGGMLLLAPGWATEFGGWSGVSHLFFTRQAGVFHFVVVIAYLGEYRRLRGVTLMVATKTIAFVFLVGAWLLGERAWSVPLSGFADGAMGLLVALVHRAAAGGSVTLPASNPSSS